MLIRFASYGLVLLLSGCALFGIQSKLSNQAGELAPIPGELTQAYNQGLVLLKAQRHEEAQQHWLKTARNWPEYPGVWSNLALSFWHLEQFENALKSANQALKIDAGFCPVQSLQALLLKEAGQFQDSILAYQKAQACEPSNPDIPFNLGILYDLYLQDLTKALAYYQEAQGLQQEKDETLAMWIEDLKNRLPESSLGNTQ